MPTINLDSPPKPCDYFDMICGTSTGDLIAIMLARLKNEVLGGDRDGQTVRVVFARGLGY
ncbi:hypothetical protein H9L39_02319 [Fusarium oxysporum f. sp. albedinis]|nr:hypothetical protein FOMA001_g2163 [Fusarium oxysporum f. sp. matthiolae]KAK2488392.1 hypothetical protein H9L39_02319 [Fusarium oxysporum f. sp. albedinis]